jgi:predicted naringenin-chalcone synthase
VLFVLQRALEEKFTGRRFISSLGPGFTASFLTMLQ